MKKGMVWLLALVMAMFLAACGDDEDSGAADGPQGVCQVVNETAASLTVVGVPIGDTTLGGFSFAVNPNSASSASFPIANTTGGTGFAITVTPAGGVALRYNHYFTVVDPEYQIIYNGILGGPGGAGDMT